MTRTAHTACPFCNDGKFIGNDCTGRTRVYRCHECKGSGDALDCNIDNVTSAGVSLSRSVADAMETMAYFQGVANGGDHGGEGWTRGMTDAETVAYAAEAVRQQMPAVKTMTAELEAFRAAWSALNRARKMAKAA